jgi:aspartate/methionine/tyrosine aminotransferase
MRATSQYMLWAKTESQARFNLATSGVLELPLSELGVQPGDVEITGPSYYGYPPLQESLARRLRVSADSIVAATGTSMANFLAMAVLLEPGDAVLIEDPTYDPILAVARYLGAEVQRVPRWPKAATDLDLDAIQARLTSRTRLIVLTNLHNPTSARINDGTLRAIGELALRAKARVLVDEVYLEALFEKEPPSAFHLGPPFLATSSLTKAYGLGGLRCGWVIAEPETAEKMWRLNDLFGNIPAHAAERLSLLALSHLEKIAGRARDLLDRNRGHVRAFLGSRSDLEAVVHDFGTVVFPRFLAGSADAFCAFLKEKHETSVVPGRFFECPDHFRLGFGGRTDLLLGALERLGGALDAFARGDFALRSRG